MSRLSYCNGNKQMYVSSDKQSGDHYALFFESELWDELLAFEHDIRRETRVRPVSVIEARNINYDLTKGPLHFRRGD